jgi:hypothetical protein
MPIGRTDSVIGANAGSEPWSAFGSLEKPSSHKSNVRRGATEVCTPRPREDLAAIASAYASLRSAGAARLQLLFGARIAAAELTGRPDEIRAAISALVRERDAAVKNLNEELRLAERSHIARVRRARQKGRRRFLASGPKTRRGSEFARVAGRVCRKIGRSRRNRPTRCRFISSTLLRRLDPPIA